MSNYNFKLDLETENTMSVIDRWVKPEHSVLEFGPANGRLTRHLAQNKNCAMTVVELDSVSGEEAAVHAEKSYLGSELGDIEKYHWLETDRKYDYIIFADVLEHLHEPETVLKKCGQLLNNNGSILISVPNLGHNSIIISLLNDWFSYSETGLLDRTHIHFFTYQTLLKMIEDSGYHINEIVPIYSRVGDNEIPVTYEQIPVSVERYLRKRKTGNVYQFVCRISKTDTGDAWKDSVRPFMQEYHRQIEAQCYYISSQQPEFSDDARMRVCFATDEDIHLRVNLPPRTQTIRLDPLEEMSIVLLKTAEIVTKNGKHHALQVHQSTAEYAVNNLYFFTDCDPYFIFRDVPDIDEEIEFRAVYQVLSFSEPREFYKKVIDVLSGVLEGTDGLQIHSSRNNEELQKWAQQLERNETELRDALALREADINAANVWIAHLERNVAEINDAREAERQTYDSAMSEARAWIAHLERNIAEINDARAAELQAYDSAMSEARAWIAHLEQDIKNLQRTINGEQD